MTSGILLLNKPLGLSSNQALQKVRKLFGNPKAGHTGTLDPMATGMLPICFQQTTKVIEYLLASDKAYRTTIQLGKATSTGDAEGDIIQTQSIPALTKPMIEAALKEYRGTIVQIPPMYSALKHQGRPLYELAREGIEIERQTRKITIYKLTLIEFTPDTLTLEVICSKGTYIRTLGEDLAESLGTCGHLKALHRLYCAGFQQKPMVTLEELQQRLPLERESLLLPTDTGLLHWPEIEISTAQAVALLQGKPLSLNHPNGQYRLYRDEQLFALAHIQNAQIKDRKIIHIDV